MWGRKANRIADLEARLLIVLHQLGEANEERDSWRWAAKQAMGSHDDLVIRRTRERDEAMRNLRGAENQLGASRARAARYRKAWQSARRRADAYGEGILRHVEERDTYAGWLEQEQAATAYLRSKLPPAEVAS